LMINSRETISKPLLLALPAPMALGGVRPDL
jgi:hypothetical protein